jgi:hypothetical protein
MPHKDPEKRRVYNREYWKAYKVAGKTTIDAYAIITKPKKRRAWNEANKARNAVAARAWRAKNKEKLADMERERARKYPDRVRIQARRRTEALAGRPKPERCEACGNTGNSKGIVFDHCHNRHHFRGWLCSNCNVALGLLKDDPNRLRQLLAYLERTRDSTSPQLTLSGI